MLWWEKIRKICQGLAFEHKIDKPNPKLSTYYRVIGLYSKDMSYNIVVVNKFLDFSGMDSTPKLSKYVTVLPFALKAIHCIPTDLS